MLKVSEQFYSIQGEGPNTGRPYYFLRLAGCNLLCGGPRTHLDKQLSNGATWRCDTIEVWMKGRYTDNQTLADEINSHAHKRLLITGGEPLLQQEDLMHFLEYINASFIEIETNGTLVPELGLKLIVNQWNVSPKLSNSGMGESSRINPEAIKTFTNMPNVCFKFVITKLEDFDEVLNDYVIPFNIEPGQIYLMPGADNQNALRELSPLVAELAMKHELNFSNRLHIEIWNQKTGV